MRYTLRNLFRAICLCRKGSVNVKCRNEWNPQLRLWSGHYGHHSRWSASAISLPRGILRLPQGAWKGHVSPVRKRAPAGLRRSAPWSISLIPTWLNFSRILCRGCHSEFKNWRSRFARLLNLSLGALVDNAKWQKSGVRRRSSMWVGSATFNPSWSLFSSPINWNASHCHHGEVICRPLDSNCNVCTPPGGKFESFVHLPCYSFGPPCGSLFKVDVTLMGLSSLFGTNCIPSCV